MLRRAEVDAQLQAVDTLEAVVAALEAGAVDLVLADYHLAGFTGLEAFEAMRARRLDLPFILVSGAIGEDTVAEAMVRGVSDYVDKNRLARLPQVIRRATELVAARRAEAQANQALAASRRRLAELTEHLQQGIERERADIAREIHDDIGGSLAAVKLDLGWLGRRSTDDATRQHVQTALEMVEHALGASQRIMRHLRPAVLDDGLKPAIAWLVAGFTGRTQIPVRFRGQIDRELAPALELVVYRTAQEALTNILKHAQAREVRVELSDLEGFLTLEVSDDGQGASDADLAKLRSFGLLGLRERAAMVGGWIDVVTRPGQGLSLILSLPLDGASSLGEEGEA